MSKVRINDLAREMEVKSRQILDVLTELGLANGKTHSSSLELDEAEKVRAHVERGRGAGGHGGSQQSRTSQGGIAPKFDFSHISKPGDAAKAILAKKLEAEQEARHPHVPARPPATPPATVVKTAPPAAATAEPAAPAAKVEPRKMVVPAPRQAPNVVIPPPAAPAIASKPPAGPVVAKAPIGAAAATRPVVTVAPPTKTVVVKPAVPREAPPRLAETPIALVKPPAPVAAPAPVAEAAVAEPVAAAPSAVAAEPIAAEAVAAAQIAAPEAPAAETVLQPASAHTAAPRAAQTAAQAPVAPPLPIRRVVMPQTGPRPVYKAPVGDPDAPAAAASAAGTGIQRGKPIFDRRPSTGPTTPGGGFRPRPGGPPSGAPMGQFAGSGPRPKHPTRTTPGGFAGAGAGPGGPGGRPGFGARPGFGPPRPGMGGRPGAGGAPPTGEAPRPQRAPSRRPGGRQQYPKTKEGPMKGFVPPPRYGGQQYSSEPLPITREITVTEGISVKDLAEKLEIRAKDLIASLLMSGVFVTVNQSLDAEMVKEVAAKFGAAATVISYEEEIANQSIE
jgi:translation initiation factor IF-2